MRARPRITAALLVGVGGALTWALWPRPARPDVVFIVLDTVRSDHLSLCGDDRPTSPNLRALAEQSTWTCGAVAPGSWTLPSHASFFTGLTPTAHHAHAITSGVSDFSGSASRSRPLQKKNGPPTLAEQLGEQGYETVMVSGNPVVGEGMGLARGFSVTHVAEKFGELAEDALVDAVGEALSAVPEDAPLFLFVNIAEAHQRWAPIPAGLSWVKPQRNRHLLKYAKLSPDDLWRRYVEGRLSEEAVAAVNHGIDALYAYNVWRADRTLGGVLAQLEASGRCGEGCRLVVTSDHGEMLGEHMLLDHGHYVWESDVRVPLLVRGVEEPPDLSQPISALHAFHLLRDGHLPDVLTPPSSVAWPHMRRCYHTRGKAFCSTSAALWDGDDKLVWMHELSALEPTLMRFDLSVDPDETSPLPLTADHPRYDELIALSKATIADSGSDQEEIDKSVIEALRAAGYLE